MDNNITEQSVTNSKKNKNSVALIFIGILFVILIGIGIYFIKFKDNNRVSKENIYNNKTNFTSYHLTGNYLEDFDLYFLKLENNKKNILYSPLSIKYALGMLQEGTDGESKEQISNVIGSYKTPKYTNSSNMSFANGLFIKDSFKNSIKDSYINTLSNKYNAEVVYDSFVTPNTLNSWVSDKTFKLVDEIADDISTEDFILVNALAIDMEWVNKIQNENEEYDINFAHRDYSLYISDLINSGYSSLEFNNTGKKAKSVEIGAVINRYDILKVIGEDNIREIVSRKYEEWLSSENYEWQSCNPGEDMDVKTFVDGYIKEISEGYNDVSSSTDFYYYNDDNVRVFAKDLKEYDGTTLQYIGIMPNKDSLDNYIKDIKASQINSIINNLKTIELNNFKDGVITEIKGYIPMFNFDYELQLKDDLNKLGITNVFDSKKADLSKMTSSNSYISSASHKANVEFSNNGIKAAAVTTIGGRGAGGCGFDYLYEVPVEKIDLTFNKPYMFIIRDKNSGEVWFTGAIYEPVEYQEFEY